MSTQEFDHREDSSRKERSSATLFEVRFGFGPHTINPQYSNWVNELGQDMNSFFVRSDYPRRNIFYFEDATGSKSFSNTLRDAYRNYGSYADSYAYASLHLNRIGKDYYPDKASLDMAFEGVVKSGALGTPNMVDSARFMLRALGIVDDLVAAGIDIEICTETRKDQGERNRVSDLIDIITDNKAIRSIDEFLLYTKAMWNLQRLRDGKITSDLLKYHKKALKQNDPTRIYVSMGIDHVRLKWLLQLGMQRYSNFKVSVIQGSVNQQIYSLTLGIEEALSLLASGVNIASDQWQSLFEEARSGERALNDILEV